MVDIGASGIMVDIGARYSGGKKITITQGIDIGPGSPRATCEINGVANHAAHHIASSRARIEDSIEIFPADVSRASDLEPIFITNDQGVGNASHKTD
jgi:hypothetical protein